MVLFPSLNHLAPGTEVRVFLQFFEAYKTCGSSPDYCSNNKTMIFKQTAEVVWKKKGRLLELEALPVLVARLGPVK